MTAAVLLSILFATISVATPIASATGPIVITPGSGMPSLESLGVTAEQLADPNFGNDFLGQCTPIHPKSPDIPIPQFRGR
jgi:hypothetical protein